MNHVSRWTAESDAINDKNMSPSFLSSRFLRQTSMPRRASDEQRNEEEKEERPVVSEPLPSDSDLGEDGDEEAEPVDADAEENGQEEEEEASPVEPVETRKRKRNPKYVDEPDSENEKPAKVRPPMPPPVSQRTHDPRVEGGAGAGPSSDSVAPCPSYLRPQDRTSLGVAFHRLTKRYQVQRYVKGAVHTAQPAQYPTYEEALIVSDLSASLYTCDVLPASQNFSSFLSSLSPASSIGLVYTHRPTI